MVVADDGYAPTADCNDDRAGLDQLDNCMLLDDPLGRWRRNDPSPATPGVFDNRPPHFLAAHGFLPAHEGTDRFRRVLEGRVAGIDFNLGDERDRLGAAADLAQAIAEILLQVVTDPALGVGATHIERLLG